MIKQINSEIFILGMGISGISLAKYLIKKKIPVTCWDDNPERRKITSSLKIKINNMTKETFENCNYLVYSYIDLYKGELKSDSLAAKILSFTYRYVPSPILIVINNRYYPARTLSFL